MSFLSGWWLLGFVGLVVWIRYYGWDQKWLLTAVALGVLALARPVLSEQAVQNPQSGSDVIFAVDVSYSMRGTDIAPSRLEAASRMLTEAISHNESNRYGVIAFTTSAIVLSPLTNDKELLTHLFGELDVNQIITKGTNVMSALELARKMSHAKRPSVIVLTDGGDEVNYAKEAEFIRDNDMSVSVVMLASAQGSMLPLQQGGVLHDEQGHIVISSRNGAIREIVEAGEGRFIEGDDGAALFDVIEQMRRESLGDASPEIRHQELFMYPLALALISFVLAFIRLPKKLIVWLAFVGIHLHAGVLDPLYAYAGSREYHHHHYETSAQWFRKIQTSFGKYNYANALYKEGKYQGSLVLYRAISSNDVGFKSDIYYNMGNCYVRLGEFSNARDAYLKSLTLRYTHEADQNLRAIASASEQQTLNVRKEKKDKMAADENKPTGEGKKTKEGGGSNMQSDIATSGAGDGGKKVQSDPRFSQSQGKAQLSSRQYELINQGGVHETKPW
jgi:Ca-activated chloride channel family protein